jgi:phage gp29-like protein
MAERLRSLSADELPIVDQGTRPPERVEFFSPLRRRQRTYPGANITPRGFLDLLREADDGYLASYMEFLDDVADDSQIKHLLETRKNAVAHAKWVVDPADESTQANEIALHAREFLEAIPQFGLFRSDLLDAHFRSFAVVDPIWEPRGRREWRVVAHRAIETRYFRVRDGQLLIETDRAPAGEPIPPGLLLHVVRDKAGPLVRSGTGRVLAKLYIYSAYDLIDMAGFIEKHGDPYILLKVPPSFREGTAEWMRARDAALGLMNDQIGFVPAGVDIQFLNAVQSATTVEGVHLAFQRWLSAEKAKVVLGQAETSEMADGGSSKARAAVANELRQDRKESDANALDETLTRWLRTWTTYHYGANAPAPRFRSLVAAPVDEQKVNAAKLVRVQALSVANTQLGIDLSLAQVREELGLRAPEKGDESDRLAGSRGASAPLNAGGASSRDLIDRHGACPGCGASFSLALAEKKKRFESGP